MTDAKTMPRQAIDADIACEVWRLFVCTPNSIGETIQPTSVMFVAEKE